MPESIWFRDDARPRRPRLSRERIVEAAVALLDAEGVAGFSMRALAARLHAGTMSLYEYVTSKEDVLDLALDEVFSEIEPETPPETPPGPGPGTTHGPDPGTPPGPDPGAARGPDPGTPLGPDPRTPSGSGLRIPPGSGLRIPSGPDPGTPPGPDLGTPSGSDLGTPREMEPGAGPEVGSGIASEVGAGGTDADGGGGGAGGVPGWRAVVVWRLSRSRAMMRRHPWVPALTATRPLLGPNALAGSRLFYATLAGAGLGGPTLAAAVGTLSSYVNGFVAAENTWWATVRTAKADAELRERVARHLDREAADLSRHALVEDSDFDRSFLLGLDLILDGIESRLRPAAGSR
ncbi:TetR/AcrR family transcriptional regulator [Nonomuraea sp. NPDC050783]|uniref:TetR/AcrR family transcriptional regulator n=1 Tax=Nonomuraea sp. NPDC050783 TaxID=3154634 RepID=UPI003466CF7B